MVSKGALSHNSLYDKKHGDFIDRWSILPECIVGIEYTSNVKSIYLGKTAIIPWFVSSQVAVVVNCELCCKYQTEIKNQVLKLCFICFSIVLN